MSFFDNYLQRMAAFPNEGIESEGQNPQVVYQHDTCVNCPPPCLHSVCTDEALLEIIAAWHALAPEVREKIIILVRSG